MFFNFDEKDKELEHQYQIIAALEIIDYKINSTNNKSEQDLGLLMPLYENEYDLGAYGFIGTNGTRIILIKKLLSFEEEGENKNITNIFHGIYNAYSKLIMNPFFDKMDLNNPSSTSKIKTTFLNDIKKIINTESSS